MTVDWRKPGLESVVGKAVSRPDFPCTTRDGQGLAAPGSAGIEGRGAGGSLDPLPCFTFLGDYPSALSLQKPEAYLLERMSVQQSFSGLKDSRYS